MDVLSSAPNSIATSQEEGSLTPTCSRLLDIWTKILRLAHEPCVPLSIARYLFLLKIAPKLSQCLAATMIGYLLDWLGTFFMPMIYDALSLRWLLPTYLTLSTYFLSYLSVTQNDCDSLGYGQASEEYNNA
jgi:hypothetical protein